MKKKIYSKDKVDEIVQLFNPVELDWFQMFRPFSKAHVSEKRLEKCNLNKKNVQVLNKLLKSYQVNAKKKLLIMFNIKLLAYINFFF